MRTGRSVSGEADKEIDVRAVGVFHIIRNFGLLVNALNAKTGKNDGRSRAFG